MELKKFQAEKRKMKARIVLHNFKRSLRAIILLIAPFIISWVFWFNFMNPTGYYQNFISLIFYTLTVCVLFFIELNIFDP